MSAPIPPWEPLSEPVLADQRGTYDRMRAAGPLAESPRGVTLFRHADVVAAANDPTTFSSAASAHRTVPNSLDPPEHTAFRAIIDQFFTPVPSPQASSWRPATSRFEKRIRSAAGGECPCGCAEGFPAAGQPSLRRTEIGGTEAARVAGTSAASTPTAIIDPHASAIARGSSGFT